MKKTNHITLLSIASFAIICGFFLSGTASFCLAYREQQQLFMFDWGYVWDVLSQVGGLSKLAARFLVQFFYSNVTAVVVTTALLCLIAFLTYRLLDKIIEKESGHSISNAVLCIVPSFLMMVCSVDNFLHYEFIIAVILALSSALLLERIRKYRLAVGSVIAVILYLVAGSASLIFSVSVLFVEVLRQRNVKSLLFVLLPVISKGLAAVAFLTGNAPTLSYGMTAEFFYELTSPVQMFFHLAWFSIPVVILISGLLSSAKKAVVPVAVSVVALAAAIYFGMRQEMSILKEANAIIYRYEYYVQRQMWQELESATSRNLGRYEDGNYYNLAKSRQGTMAEEILKHVQPGPFSIVHIPDAQSADMRLAYVLYEMGNIAAAENVAFNGMRTLSGFKPSMVKICTDVEIARGIGSLASKYNAMLLKSLHYRKWAKMRQSIIDGLTPIESVPEIARAKSVLPETDGFIIDPSPIEDLYRILDTNPSDRKAVEYTLSLLLLSKDYDAVYEFVKKYHPEGPLPTPVQEALVFMWDYHTNASLTMLLKGGLTDEKMREYSSLDKQWFLSNGVEEKTFSRFEAFKKAYAEAGGSNVEIERKSFWYYTLFVKF